MKKGLGIDVLTAARERIRWVFDNFPRIYTSFSGGKDSGVMLHLVMDEARARGRRVGVLFVDFESQYRMTIDYIADMYALYAGLLDPYWVALPINLRNAVSQFEPQWTCWDPERRDDWVRDPHPLSITDPSFFPFYRHAMEFEEFTPEFGQWYSQGQPTACFVGIRTDESLNRYRTIGSGKKQAFDGRQWTTWLGGGVWNVYPIYDWRTEDIWTYYGKFKMPYNRLYDRMHQAGLTIHQARICQPYGDRDRDVHRLPVGVPLEGLFERLELRPCQSWRLDQHHRASGGHFKHGALLQRDWPRERTADGICVEVHAAKATAPRKKIQHG
jgi:predicted phosphoadenosine phosphosulfate sulfurtransferase